MHSSQSPSPMIPEQESELLSAYLDNQLSGAERVTLERRLQQVPTLRAELGELQATVAGLRALEPVSPPRSFTLDPAQARRARPGWSLPWLIQFGSGLAGLLLVLVATVQLLNPAPERMMASMEPIPTAFAPMVAPAPMMAPAAESAPAPMMAPAAEAPPDAVAADGVPEVAIAERMPEATSEAFGEIDSGLDVPAQDTVTAAGAAEAPTNAPVVAAAPPNAQTPRNIAPSWLLALGLLLLSIGIGGYLLRRRTG